MANNLQHPEIFHVQCSIFIYYYSVFGFIAKIHLNNYSGSLNSSFSRNAQNYNATDDWLCIRTNVVCLSNKKIKICHLHARNN